MPVPPTIPTVLSDSEADAYVNTFGGTDDDGNNWTRTSVQSAYAAADAKRRRMLHLAIMFALMA